MKKGGYPMVTKSGSISKLEFMDYEESNNGMRLTFNYDWKDINDIDAFIKNYCKDESLQYEVVEDINIIVDIYNKCGFAINAELIKDNCNIETVEIPRYKDENLVDFIDIVYKTQSIISKKAYLDAIKSLS